MNQGIQAASRGRERQQKKDSPQILQKEWGPVSHLIVAQGNSWISDLQNAEVVSVCCFEATEFDGNLLPRQQVVSHRGWSAMVGVPQRGESQVGPSVFPGSDHRGLLASLLSRWESGFPSGTVPLCRPPSAGSPAGTRQMLSPQPEHHPRHPISPRIPQGPLSCLL